MPYVNPAASDIIYAQDVDLIYAGLTPGTLGVGLQWLGIPAAPSVATGASGALTGAYKYLVTFCIARRSDNAIIGESLPGTASATVNPASQRVTVSSIPVCATAVCNARRIYRTVAGGSTYKLLTTILDNTTTTYSDNTGDGSLGANAPTVDTADGSMWSSQRALWNQFIGVNS